MKPTCVRCGKTENDHLLVDPCKGFSTRKRDKPGRREKRKTAYTLLKSNYYTIMEALEDYAKWFDNGEDKESSCPEINETIKELENWDGKR